MPTIPLAAFTVPLTEFQGAWLEIECCAGRTYAPLRAVLAGRRVGTVGSLLVRLRCHHCRQAPRGAALVGHADHTARTGRRGWGDWRVVLIEPE
jgi:hypothetical protein